MKKQLLSAALVLAAFAPILAQEKSQTEQLGREITLGLGGLNLNNFNWFQLGFKKEKGPERYSRTRFNGSFSGAFDKNQEQINFNLNAASGEETRRKLNDRLFFVRGYEVWAGIGLSGNSDNQNQGSISVGGGWVFGLQYRFGEQFYLGLEAVPGVRLNSNYTPASDRVSIQIAGDIGSAGALHFGVRF